MNYIARVELHTASYDDYEQLHVSMANRGYDRTITGGDGRTYQLPTGTYVARDVNATLQTAQDAAKAAAGETGRKYWVIVANWDQAQWAGLPSVN
jgi:hypothetical protein